MQVFVGPVYHSRGIDQFTHHPLVSIGVENGKIVHFKDLQDLDLELEHWNKMGITPIVCKPKEFIIPGLIDTHIHGPQYVFTGTGYDMSLLEWLETYTFPREADFHSLEYAKANYAKVVRKTLRFGTTTASYFATTHLESSVILAETCQKLGQRAFVGKVNMDRNSPQFYTETTVESIQKTIEFVEKVKSVGPLVTPCITPRFVPTCTPSLMQFLGDLSLQHSLPIQSHLSETPSEISWVKELHPEHANYSSVYAANNLLTERTIMAHCVHLDQEERNLLLKHKVGISHCSSSNFCLHSGCLNVRRLLEEGHEKIGLGTDVAGGYSASILDAMRQSIITSKVVHMDSKNSDKVWEPLGFAEVFYLATLGGAKCMGLDHLIGNFEVGKEFDALIVSLDERLSDEGQVLNNVDIFEHDTPESIFEKFVYLGDDRNIKQVYVAGKKVV